MNSDEIRSWIARFGWPLLILLLAAVLRFHDLPGVPPGMTHDEADHGLTAWQIASEGVREIYFTIGYGREPLYDYAVAGLMSFLGPTILAARLVSVFAGLILIAAMISWVKLAFNSQAAVMTGAGLALGFWPLMSSRQALRSVLLPALFVLAVLVFWLAYKNVLRGRKSGPFWRAFNRTLPFAAAGLLLGLTIYTYIPARALWIIFPALLLYWLVRRRELIRPMWWRIGLMLLVMALVAAPLLAYLQANPEAEARIRQLAQPLLLAQQGDWRTLAAEAYDSLQLFFIEGDPAWRYNLDQRPFLTPIFGLLFVLGLGQALWWLVAGNRLAEDDRGSAAFLSLSWLVVGFVPALVTGPELSMTQAIAVQPLIYLFPALALAAGGSWVAARPDRSLRYFYTAVLLLLFGSLAVTTWRDYFQLWANHPQVRVQYETTMVTVLDYLNRYGSGEAAVSTITPGPFHSPAVAQMVVDNEKLDLRWFDGRGSLLLPRDDEALLLLPGFTPLPDALERYLDTAELEETLPLREDDLDRPLRIYRLNRPVLLADWQEQLTPAAIGLDDALELTGFDLQPHDASPGDTISLITFWQAREPVDDIVLFSHLLGQDGTPLAQADRLDVPASSWSAGDSFLQVHDLALPQDLPPGTYDIAVGAYQPGDGRRLTVVGSGGADLAVVTAVTVGQ